MNDGDRGITDLANAEQEENYAITFQIDITCRHTIAS